MLTETEWGALFIILDNAKYEAPEFKDRILSIKWKLSIMQELSYIKKLKGKKGHESTI